MQRKDRTEEMRGLQNDQSTRSKISSQRDVPPYLRSEKKLAPHCGRRFLKKRSSSVGDVVNKESSRTGLESQ
jgi:hypothetical protein